jgi:hypothetical protein
MLHYGDVLLLVTKFLLDEAVWYPPNGGFFKTIKNGNASISRGTLADTGILNRRTCLRTERKFWRIKNVF